MASTPGPSPSSPGPTASADGGTAANGGAAAVLTLHGWGGTRTGPHRLFVTLGRELAAAGRTTLRFDHAGRGASDGDAATACLDGMIADAIAAVDLLVAECGAPRVDLVGLCSGGNVALGAATRLGDRVGRVVCVSTLPFAPQPAARGRRKALGYLKQYARKALSPRTWRRLLAGEVNVGGVGKVLGDSLREDAGDRSRKDSRRDIMAELRSLRAPVTFLYGGGDPEAPPAREHYEAFCRTHGLDATFDQIPDANHNFYAQPWANALRARIRQALGA